MIPEDIRLDDYYSFLVGFYPWSSKSERGFIGMGEKPL